MNATRTFLPSASSPSSVHGPSPSTCPFSTFCPTRTIGFWFVHVFWLELLAAAADVRDVLAGRLVGLAREARADAILSAAALAGHGGVAHGDDARGLPPRSQVASIVSRTVGVGLAPLSGVSGLVGLDD